MDKERLRPSDVPAQVGDPTRLRAHGLGARLPLEDSLFDLLQDWRARVDAASAKGAPR